jgi:RluA family pseudouridine synthase
MTAWTMLRFARSGIFLAFLLALLLLSPRLLADAWQIVPPAQRRLSRFGSPLCAKPPPKADFDLAAIEAFEKQLDDQADADDESKDNVKQSFIHSDCEEDKEEVDTVLTLTIDPSLDGQRLDAALVAALDHHYHQSKNEENNSNNNTSSQKVTRSTAGQWITEGRVQVDGQGVVTRKSHPVSAGQVLTVRRPSPAAKAATIIAQDLPLDILYEDDVMIVLNKAAGMVVHPAVGHWEGTVVNALEYYLVHRSPYGPGEFGPQPRVAQVNHRTSEDGNSSNNIDDEDDEDEEDTVYQAHGDDSYDYWRPGIVHRLDKGTTGVLVVAKTKQALASLSAAFAERRVQKTYLAITVGNPGQNVVIDKPIGRHPIHRQRMRVVPAHRQRDPGSSSAGRRALSYVDTVAFDGRALSLVQVRIATGRTHQIRVHLADRHTPIYGDDVYGRADWNQKLTQQLRKESPEGASRPLLHAYRLTVPHPVTGKTLHFEAPMPEDMQHILRGICGTNSDWKSLLPPNDSLTSSNGTDRIAPLVDQRTVSPPLPQPFPNQAEPTRQTLANEIHASPPTFSRDMWNAYTTLMKDIMTRDRVVKKVPENLLLDVQSYLLADSIVSLPNLLERTSQTGTSTDPAAFRCSTRDMYKSFGESRNWSQVQLDYLERCLSYMVDWCAKKQLVSPAIIAWYKLRETSFVPRERAVSTFLFVLGLPSPGMESISQTALADVATFHDACFEANEKTVFLRIKSLVAAGDATKAEELLLAIPDCQRLRTFTPLLVHYCQTREIADCLRIFRQMQNAPGVHFDTATYVQILSTLAEQGFFSDSSHSLDVIVRRAGFESAGPALFDALASEMAEDLLEFDEANALHLYNAFQMALNGPTEKSPRSASNKIPFLATPSYMSNTTAVLGRVTIDPQTCLCPATHAKLQLFSLTLDQQKQVRQRLLEMAASQHETFASKMRTMGKSRQDTATRSGAYAMDKLNDFVEWVAERNFTAIIDGPNVAYFGHPVLHYSQIARMVEHLEKLGERPLVTMPFKYCQSSFYVTTINQEQTLSNRDLEVISDLRAKDQLFIVPEWCLDDYYWMIGSVVLNNRPPRDSTSLPGLRPLLITNDQMRDHHLELLEPRLFQRWTSCHIVRYNFGSYEEDEWADDRDVLLFPANSYSHEIQGNPSPIGSTAWHIPVAEWRGENSHDCFCISLPRRSD